MQIYFKILGIFYGGNRLNSFLFIWADVNNEPLLAIKILWILAAENSDDKQDITNPEEKTPAADHNYHQDTTDVTSTSVTSDAAADAENNTSQRNDQSDLMPDEQLYSDDSDTAGYYQVSANASANSPAAPDDESNQSNQRSYQRGLLSTSR